MKTGPVAPLLAAVLLCALVGAGCENQHAPRSVLRVVRIAETSTELYYDTYAIQSDVISVSGSTGTVYEDEVFVTFENQPRSDLLSINSMKQYGAVILTHYTVQYDVEGEYIEPLSAGLNLTVESGGTAIAEIVVVSAIAKTRPPLSTLADQQEELLATARLTFYGYEQSSQEHIETSAFLQIHFANWAG